MKRKVLVIGAGASGLPSLKTALEHGFDAVCLEMSNDIGGLWRYKENPEEGEGTVMKSTVINTSKEMTAFSDFPPLADTANYMHNKEMLNYLRRYAEHFQLLKHIRLRHKVINVERCKNFAETGKWSVKYRDSEGHFLVETFDGVMCCTGHHTTPYFPASFEGQGTFKGRLIHSLSYHTCTGFENQNVVVVGLGNSGGDIAVELSKVANKVQLATRSGAWIINRVWQHGEPSDLALLNRFTFFAKRLTPKSLQNRILEDKVNRRFDHGRFGLKPAHRFLEAHVTVNDELPNRIISGTVVIKPNIARFTETDVIFEDGTKAENVDVVIFATGFSFDFPYLEEGKLVPVEENRVLLYKQMFPPQLSPRTLAFIGLIQPTGSIMPISEMQARLFCSLLAGNASLPSSEEMMRDALKTSARLERKFKTSRRHTLQVNYVDYMESLAKMIKVRPNVPKYLITDPRLAVRLVFYGLVPYQYRLEGPYSSSKEARCNILEFDERVFNCTRTRLTEETARAKPKSKIFSIFSLLR